MQYGLCFLAGMVGGGVFGMTVLWVIRLRRLGRAVTFKVHVGKPTEAGESCHGKDNAKK